MDKSEMQQIPHQSYLQVFLRFLRFGLLAWGGPVPQLAMIRQELVEEGKWISPERFNRTLAVYQALPGPEAHEMCVYFGLLARGRLGGFLAGLGFMLPGFLLMFMLSWLYVTQGFNTPLVASIFYGCQAAVGALILRAVHRIGGHALLDRWLWAVAIVAGIAALLGTHFLIILFLAGAMYVLSKRESLLPAVFVGIGLLGISIVLSMQTGNLSMVVPEGPEAALSSEPPSPLKLLWSGLRSGLLTFGGAYTVIPFLQHDAVQAGAWMTNRQFLDGLALSGLLPAPLIIFATFVGYLGGGPLGALALTAGIFTPAFSFTLVGHRYLEKIVQNKSLHAFNDGVTAGVVGLISATTVSLLRAAIPDVAAIFIFAGSLFLAYRLKAKTAVVFIVLIAGAVGLLFKQLS